jgi:hypothetical protein
MEFGFTECVMEGHSTVVVLNCAAWLVPKLCCIVQHGSGSVEIKCGDYISVTIIPVIHNLLVFVLM